jgi:hypothetical protein
MLPRPLSPSHARRDVLPAKRAVDSIPTMTMVSMMTSPGGSGLSVVSTGALLLLFPGEGARGPNFPLASILPKIRTTRTMTPMLAPRGEGRELSVISIWPRAVLEVSRGALAVPLSISTDMSEPTPPTPHLFIQPIMWAISICLR